MTTAQERLFAYMGVREAYDKFYALSPETAAEWEAERTAEFDAAPERDVSQDNIFDVAVYPDEYRSKEYAIRGWAADIQYALTKLADKVEVEQ